MRPDDDVPYDDPHEEHPHEPVDGFFVDLFEAEMVPPRWLIQDLLPIGLVFLIAPPKAMKSTITMAMALNVAGFKCNALPPFLSMATEHGRVVAFSSEADAGELRHMVEEGMKAKGKPDKSILIAEDSGMYRLDDEDGLEKMLFWLNELKPKLVILDPLAEFHAVEEKDAGGMVRLFRPIRRWVKDNNATFLVVHHTRKPLDSSNHTYSALDMRGTSALFGMADGVIALTPKGEPKVGISAVFKRGHAWDRTISVAAYGHVNVAASEELRELDKEVLKLFRAGAKTLDQISEQLHVAKKTVVECAARLERNGYLKKDGRKFVPTARKE